MARPVNPSGALVRALEAQRRRRLLGLLIPTGIILTSIAIISGAAAIIQGQAQAGMTITVSLSVFLVACMSGAGVALRRERVDIATLLFTSSAVLTIVGIVTVLCVATPFSAQSLVQLACLSIVVVLAGAVGDARTIILAAALESLVITLIFLLVPAAGPLAGAMLPQRLILIIGTLTYHWAIAALLIAVVRTLRQTLDSLEQTTNELTQAQQIDDLKDQFITQVNHELRTPIMSLQGYVDLIYELDVTLSAEDRHAMLVKARSAGENLIRFINDVLDTRRVDRDTDFARTGVPLRPTVADALMLIGPAEQRPIHVAVASDLAIWGEPTRLLQVLTNLLTNAIKYSPAGAPIEVAARAAADGMVEISVRDYGLGIPPEQAAALFHRFVRLERDLRSRVRGTGVGLYLCRTYVEAMGGTIHIESSGVPGAGSRFVVRLPAAGPEALLTPGLMPTRKLERSRP